MKQTKEENIQNLMSGIEKTQKQIDKYLHIKEEMYNKYGSDYKITAPTHLTFLSKLIRVLIEESMNNKHNGKYVYWLSSQVYHFNKKKLSILKYFLSRDLQSEYLTSS